MGARLIVSVGVLFGGFVFVTNVLLIIESVSRGKTFTGAAVAAVLGGAIGAGCIWALSLEAPDQKRDPFGKARFEEDRKAAEEAGLK
jgi:hypothetical protein